MYCCNALMFDCDKKNLKNRLKNKFTWHNHACTRIDSWKKHLCKCCYTVLKDYGLKAFKSRHSLRFPPKMHFVSSQVYE